MRANGFSLIECAFALVLLSGGLLSVAVTARAGNRLASLSRLGSSAVQLGLSRMARLEADGCAAASGTAQSGRFSERWTVQPARGLRRISLTISTTWQGRLRTWRYDTAVLCTVELP